MRDKAGTSKANPTYPRITRAQWGTKIRSKAPIPSTSSEDEDDKEAADVTRAGFTVNSDDSDDEGRTHLSMDADAEIYPGDVDMADNGIKKPLTGSSSSMGSTRSKRKRLDEDGLTLPTKRGRSYKPPAYNHEDENGLAERFELSPEQPVGPRRRRSVEVESEEEEALHVDNAKPSKRPPIPPLIPP
jgi:hypothetical protein